MYTIRKQKRDATIASKQGLILTHKFCTDTFYDWLEKEYDKTEAWLKNLEEKEAELKRDDMKQFGQFVGLFLTTVSILAFICCLYTRVPYLLTALSLVTLFWGLWVMVYFRD